MVCVSTRLYMRVDLPSGTIAAAAAAAPAACFKVHPMHGAKPIEMHPAVLRSCWHQKQNQKQTTLDTICCWSGWNYDPLHLLPQRSPWYFWSGIWCLVLRALGKRWCLFFYEIRTLIGRETYPWSLLLVSGRELQQQRSATNATNALCALGSSGIVVGVDVCCWRSSCAPRWFGSAEQLRDVSLCCIYGKTIRKFIQLRTISMSDVAKCLILVSGKTLILKWYL